MLKKIKTKFLSRKFISLSLTLSILFSGIQLRFLPLEVRAEYNASIVVNQNNNAIEKLAINDTYAGFKLLSKKYLNDIESTAYEFVHDKSGAKLIFLQNNDDNNVFSINFRTPTEDNSGINHIIEHSVLCGSKNYPIKDPFVQMSKQSLNTFLNALTGLDRTMYPIASKNKKDFKNLMSVYLDAVFYPNINEDLRILKQEGWHYELNNINDDIKYNGIVFNEMKGNFSSMQTVLLNKINETLFPNSNYRWVSGGDPNYITTLNAEKFLSTYKKYYVPSNSYIYLYGNVEIADSLDFINNKYLSHLEKTEVTTKIEEQKAVISEVPAIAEFSVDIGSEVNKKSIISFNYVVDKVTNVKNTVGMSILGDILFNSPSSPVRVALGREGFTNSYCLVRNDMLQPCFCIIIENCNQDDKDKLKAIIDKSLKDVVKNHIDKNMINSTMNLNEFSLKTFNSAAMRGINFNNAVMQSWTYDGEPTDYLNLNNILLQIKKDGEQGYFEELIQKYLVESKHNSIVIAKPVQGLDDVNNSNSKNLLSEYKKSLSVGELKSIIEETKALKIWQETPDTKEMIDKLPTITRNDLEIKRETIPTVESQIDGINVQNHKIFTSGISYMSMYFDTSKVPQDKLMILHLLCALLGNLDTKNYYYNELTNQMQSHLGRISFKALAFHKRGDGDIYFPKLVVNTSTLDSNMPQLFKIVEEIINGSNFTNKNLIRQAVSQIKSRCEWNISENTFDIAKNTAMSYFSNSAKYNSLDSLDFYEFIKELDKNFDERFNGISKDLFQVSSMVFNKQGLIVSYTGEKQGYDLFEKNLRLFSSKIENRNFKTQIYDFQSGVKNEGLAIPSKVQYVVKGGDFNKLGYKYNGKMKVLQKVLESDYLWKEIRVKGGAYGGNIIVSDTSIVFSSYRDPNLIETLKVFNDAGKFLKKFKADEKQMLSYIIGAIGNQDSLMEPENKGIAADIMKITGYTNKEMQKEREEILATKASDIRKYSTLIEDIIKQDYFCVAGSEGKINENKDLFRTI